MLKVPFSTVLSEARLPRHLHHVPKHPRRDALRAARTRRRERRQPVDRQERVEAVDRGAAPRAHLHSGRADQDEGNHREDRHGLGEGEAEGTGGRARSVSHIIESTCRKFQ